MIGVAVAAGEAMRKEVRVRQRSRFTRADLLAAMNGLTSARSEHLIYAACALAMQIEDMARAGRTLVRDILGSQAMPLPWAQYPQPMVEDAHVGVGYFYHTHGPSRSRPDERGHFHVFVRRVDALRSHLVGIAVDAGGMPVRLFTTNRWVTDECWMTADWLLDWTNGCSHPLAGSVSPATLWITHCIQLFYPQLEWLLHRRDERLDSLSTGRRSAAVFEDRRIEIIGECEISVRQQIVALLSSLNG